MRAGPFKLDKRTTKSDPVTLEILKNALESLADEMALIILRSAYSPIVRDSMDYSTAICDQLGRVVAQGLTNPIHLGSFPRVMQTLLSKYGDSIEEGDGFIVNDPYAAGGMHLPDIYFIRPAFWAGKLVGYATALVHHADVGGIAPGSMGLSAVEVFQEGLRIPMLRIYEKGRANEAIFELLRLNSRMPEEMIGDFRAQVSACDSVARSLAKLANKYGDKFFTLLTDLHDYAERLVRQRIAAIPDGAAEAVDYIDGLGDDGPRIEFYVKATVAGDSIHFDLTGTSGEVPGSINCPITTTYSLIYAGLRAALGPGIPNCEGYMRPISATVPRGTILNPESQAACGARAISGYRLLDAVLAALGQLIPNAVPAGGEGGPTAISFSGRRQDGTNWLITDGILGSWGGRHDSDGMEGISSPGTNLSNQPIELIEARLPVRVEQYGYVQNSGGAGRYRGGLAMIRSYCIDAPSAKMTLRSDRRRHLPSPLFGGLPGSPSLSILNRVDGSRELLPVMRLGQTSLERGDRVVHIAAGAAGYGDPLERPIGAVLEDIADGRIDEFYAREVYGVVHTKADGVDEPATAEKRAEIKTLSVAERCELQRAAFLNANGATTLLYSSER